MRLLGCQVAARGRSTFYKFGQIIQLINRNQRISNWWQNFEEIMFLINVKLAVKASFLVGNKEVRQEF